MEWVGNGNGRYLDLYDGYSIVGWVRKEPHSRAAEITHGSGTGNYYGCVHDAYVRAETLDECKALVLALARMGD